MRQRKSRLATAAVATWAGLASFVAIYTLSICDRLFDIDGVTAVTLIGSFGATAVLVYGAPSAEFSRFKNVIYGHGLSAAVGVSTSLTLGVNHALSAATSVGIAVLLMHLTDTTHPPGGATALIAVTGGERVYQLGYLYVFVPVLMGAVLMYGLGYVGHRLLRIERVLARSSEGPSPDTVPSAAPDYPAASSSVASESL